MSRQRTNCEKHIAEDDTTHVFEGNNTPYKHLATTDTTRNRPTHRPTRSKSASSWNSLEAPSLATQQFSVQNIQLFPLGFPIISKPFQLSPIPSQESSMVASLKEASSASDDSLASFRFVEISKIPPPCVYNSPIMDS